MLKEDYSIREIYQKKKNWLRIWNSWVRGCIVYGEHLGNLKNHLVDRIDFNSFMFLENRIGDWVILEELS